ncbi:MAG: SRPBCC domain-containing protein [Pirellulales bacterium]|nr:SRPBCC domain-containing protein [Pirellulales bacterium]
MTGTPRAIHDTVTVERHIAASPKQVFLAWSDPESKQRWQPTPDGFDMVHHNFDFQNGGIERLEMKQGEKTFAEFEQCYLDISIDHRIIYTVKVFADGQLTSCSKEIIEFIPQDSGTLLCCTEQVTWFHGQSMRSEHESGWATLLDRLEKEVTT